MTDVHRKLLDEMFQSPYGAALKAYLDEELKDLTDVKNCKSWEDTLARQYAEGVVHKLFSFIKGFDKPPNKTRYD